MYDVQDIIGWLLSHEDMSPKKLQKMLYYCYVWVLTLGNDDPSDLHTRLFTNRFEAWVHGPVLPDVYNQFKDHGYNAITITDVQERQVTFQRDVNDILKQVWEVYGGYNANELESLTHQEEPWIKAREGLSPLERTNNEITDGSIYSYYIQRVNG